MNPLTLGTAALDHMLMMLVVHDKYQGEITSCKIDLVEENRHAQSLRASETAMAHPEHVLVIS